MSDVTRILSAIEQGDQSAAEKLLPLVYDELRKLAAEKLAHEKPGQTIQATALVLRQRGLDRFFATSTTSPFLRVFRKERSDGQGSQVRGAVDGRRAADAGSDGVARARSRGETVASSHLAQGGCGG